MFLFNIYYKYIIPKMINFEIANIRNQHLEYVSTYLPTLSCSYTINNNIHITYVVHIYFMNCRVFRL